MALTKSKSLTASEFYGNKICKSALKPTEVTQKRECSVPFELTRLLGPTSVWKVFKKQLEVLNFVRNKKCGLMAFVFQQNNGERLFLAAHPRWLWYHDCKKSLSARCSYEIIPEYTVCKLYFDLEFEIANNPTSDGALMTDIFIKIVCFYINYFWKLVVDRTCIIDLDSSTNSKFSRHLIFNSPHLVFRDNYNVGNFVKYVCNEVKRCIEQNDECCDKHPLKSCLQKSSMSTLQVINSKCKTVLFCDEGVYTKNRHFRVFKSTKPKKDAPLILSEQNLYTPNQLLESVEERLFLDSLITYLPDANDSKKILNFDGINSSASFSTKENNNFSSTKDNNCKSPFPKIDNFIEKIAHPGRIWRNNYFQTTNNIVYDIVGNRFCGNIGRQHRSNNIKFIVDIHARCYYQKCYDPECSTYRSDSYQLPPEIQFFLDDDFDRYISENDISFELSFNEMDDTELFEIADVIEQISCNSFDK